MLELIDQYFAQALSSDPIVQKVYALTLAYSRQGHIAIDLSAHFDQPVELDSKGPVIYRDGRYYLQRNWDYESEIVEGIVKLQGEAPIEGAQPLEGLSDEQMEAILMAFNHRLLIVSGGPGCGKTFVASKIIEQMLQDSSMQIALTAPTGKAVQNLRQNLTHLDPSRVHAGTLHSLLKLRPSKKRLPSYLEAHLIVVDECSMIDLKVFAKLLSAIHPRSRLILLGDPHQLPPVESGTVFHDLCQLDLPHVHLDKCYRLESKTIAELAQAMIDETPQSVCEKLSLKALDALDYTPKLFTHPTDFAAIEAYFKSEKILCSHNVGKYGTQAVNERYFKALIEQTHEPIAFPIIVTQNLPKMGLMNGSQGIWVYHPEGGDKLYFSIDGEYQAFAKELIPKFELAFAMTIHKSQGSEYQFVHLLLSDEGEGFGKEALYTGITRCKKGIQIYATRETILASLQTTSLKDSIIKERISRFPLSPT